MDRCMYGFKSSVELFGLGGSAHAWSKLFHACFDLAFVSKAAGTDLSVSICQNWTIGSQAPCIQRNGYS